MSVLVRETAHLLALVKNDGALRPQRCSLFTLSLWIAFGENERPVRLLKFGKKSHWDHYFLLHSTKKQMGCPFDKELDALCYFSLSNFVVTCYSDDLLGRFFWELMFEKSNFLI